MSAKFRFDCRRREDKDPKDLKDHKDTKDRRQQTELDQLLATGDRSTERGTYLDLAAVHPVERLPREFAGLPNGHAGSHQFLVDDFVRACAQGHQPPNNVWMAARYVLPCIVAHESAQRGGELLAVPDFGDPPAPGML